MHFYHREHLEIVNDLGIPGVKVLPYGSAMVTWGMRPMDTAGDIDIVATKSGNIYLEQKLGFRAVRQVVGLDSEGNEKSIIARQDDNRLFDVHRWAFSMARFKVTGKGRMHIPELLAMSVQDDETGIYVANKEALLLMKADTGREKDDEDVRRIWQHHDQGY